MDVFLFIYNTALIFLYTITIVISAIFYHRSRQKIYLYGSCIFLTYVFDVFIIFIAEFLLYSRLGSERVVTSVISLPPLKLIVMVAMAFFYLKVVFLITDTDFKTIHLCLFLPLLFISAHLSCLPESKLTIWGFYSIRQLYLFGFIFYYFYRLKTAQNTDQQKRMARYKPLFRVSFFITSAIVLEDTIVILFLDAVTAVIPFMNERNFSEDILSIFYAAFLLSSIWQADKQKQSLIPSKEKPEEWKEEKTSASFHQESLFSQDEMEQKFADLYQLTKRERDIMHLLLSDKTNQEISELLYIATGTVKCHIHNIYEKMDITKRSQLIGLYYTQIYENDIQK